MPAALQQVVQRAHSGAEKKGYGQLQWAASQLAVWGTPGWRDVKEASFTATLTKLGNAKTEISIQHGDDSDVAKQLDRSIVALGHGKVFCRKYKEWSKQPKVQRLLCLSPHVEHWVAFLKEQQLVLEPSLVLTGATVVFSREPQSLETPPVFWAKRMAQAMDAGLQAVGWSTFTNPNRQTPN